MPLVQGSSRRAISENIRRERDANKPLKQAIAIALNVARRNRYAEGGSAEPDRKSIAEMLLRSPAVTAGSGVRSAVAQPFVDSYRALSGKMTEDEQKDFAFQAALGLLPVGKAAGALAGRGARRLAAEVEPAYTAMRGPATTEVPRRILDVEQAASAPITAPTIIGKAPLPDRGGVAGPVGRDEGLRQARLEAEWRAGGREPLPGLPRGAQTVEGKLFIPGPIGKVHDVADRYMAGVPGGHYGIAAPEKFYPLDKARSARIARAFDELPLYDPRALESYNAMARETLAQYQAIKNSGLKITPVDAASYPYGGNPRAVAQDVGDRGHMAFFKTEPEAGAFGSGGAGNIAQSHPLLKPSGEYIGDYPMLNNDLFRVVHDYFGHLKHGFGFRGAGEDMAWRSHAGMYSPEARPAMTSETRGQNSWVNYGPHGEFNRTASGADTIYSPQKVALMPGWTMDDLVRLGLVGAGGGLASAGVLAPGEAEAAAVPSEPLQRAEGGRAEDIDYAPDVLSTAARDVGYAPDASLPGRRDEDYLRRLAILAPPAQPRPLNMLGDALYGLGRSLSGPAANPIQPAQDAAYGAFKGMTVDPVVEAYNAVKGRMTEDEQKNMLFGAAIGMLPMGRGAARVPSGIKVFHSSPHDFEHFDASKIGTGEGAQVYGYGHYFAENPKVSGQGGEYWKQFLSRYTDMPEGYAARELMLSKFDRARALESIQKEISRTERYGPENTNLNELLAARELLKGGNPVGPRTYEVNLKARPEEFLDWDKPVFEQPRHVADAIADLAAAKRIPMGNTITGQGAYGSLQAHNYQLGMPRGGGQAEASSMLKEAGIPGIKYLDQGSRAGANPIVQRGLQRNLDIAQQELAMAKQSNDLAWIARQEKHLKDAEAAINQQLTSNYVMFPGTEHLIDITKKYAIPTTVLGGLAVQNRQDYAEGGRADEKPKPPIPRPNPFRQSQPLSSSSRPPVYGMLAQSYGNLERQMGNPELDRVMLGLDKIKNYPELRPTTQQDLDKYWAGRGEFYRTINRLKMDPAAIDRMPQSENIEYRWPVTPDDLYGDQYVREPLGAIRNYASGGRAGQVIQRAGLITSTVPGRTDKHSINVLSGSYILPADHVAHLGQDNSMAGGRVLDSMFRSNRKSPPASGDIVPIVVAGGEYLLEPDQVESVGNGDLTRGHNALDAWVKSARKKHVALLKSLPPPKTK